VSVSSPIVSGSETNAYQFTAVKNRANLSAAVQLPQASTRSSYRDVGGGHDVLIFGVAGEIGAAGGVEFAVLNDGLTGNLFVDPVNGLPNDRGLRVSIKSSSERSAGSASG